MPELPDLGQLGPVMADGVEIFGTSSSGQTSGGDTITVPTLSFLFRASNPVNAARLPTEPINLIIADEAGLKAVRTIINQAIDAALRNVSDTQRQQDRARNDQGEST